MGIHHAKQIIIGYMYQLKLMKPVSPWLCFSNCFFSAYGQLTLYSLLQIQYDCQNEMRKAWYFLACIFSTVQLAWQWTVLWKHCYWNTDKMCRFSMVDPNNLLSLIVCATRCGVKWTNCIIWHICWLVSQTEACFVHNIPCQACHCLCHFSGHRARNRKKREQENTASAGRAHHLWLVLASKWANIRIEWILE